MTEWRRATLERNGLRTRSLGRRPCCAPEPFRSRAGEPGAPPATRPAPPPLEAAAVQAPRSRLLGMALQALGRVARGALRRSPRDSNSLASAGLSRFLDLEVPTRANGSTVRRLGGCRARPHDGARQSSLGRAAHPW